MYWAGSDADGAVVGFYWAVVETLPIAPEGTTGGVPPLPGPRTHQYRYTTRTDSTFSFTVSEFAPDRQHAFYIYAVDDKGRGDPTPARVIFNALDRFPPLPVFDVAQGVGKYASVPSHGVVQFRDVVVAIRDSLDLLNSARAPSDTVPSGARIDFRWHGEPTIAGNYAVRYKYKLDEPVFVTVDSSVTSVSYNTGLGGDAVNAGTKVFTLRAIDAAGGARTGAQEVTRRFQVNKNPVTWYSGPDSNLVPVVDDPVGHRYLTMSNWSNVPSGSGSLLSCDSLYYWPSERPERKTFWEIYRDKLFLRVEDDTVDMNGFVVIQGGGEDPDSPYDVQVKPNDPPDTSGCFAEIPRVLRPGGPNGSPIGFRYQYAQTLDPDASGPSIPSPSALYPRYDASAPDRQRLVHAYPTFTQSGRVYFILRAVDGDLAIDDRLPDAYNARLLADFVDSGGGTEYERLLRKQTILTFYVNRVPYFDVGQPLFFPKPPQYNGGVTASSPDRVLRMNLPAIDPDPYDPANKPAEGGYPSPTTVLRTEVTVRGTYTSGGVTRDTTYIAPRQFTTAYNIDLLTDAPYISGTNLLLTIELCDCANCEQSPGTGRCVKFGPIPVNVPAAAAALGADTMTRPTGTKPLDTSSGSHKP